MLTQQLNHLTWLPPYSIRVSQKARRMILKISTQKSLEIILPHHYQAQKVLSFVQEKKQWIEKNIHVLKERHPVPDFILLPNELNLRACQESWKIHYIQPRIIKGTIN